MTDVTAAGATVPTPLRRSETPLLFEVSWEVCNQVGGIYQVLRSKAPAMVRRWGDRYFVVGPDLGAEAAVEFDEGEEPPPFLAPVLQVLAASGVHARYGRWLVSGRPQAILVGHDLPRSELNAAKYFLWADHSIATPEHDPLIDAVVGFGIATHRFFAAIAERLQPRPVVAHFHEWMGGLAIPRLRREGSPLAIVFTTHATVLGRYLANDRPDLYGALPHLDHAAEAARYQITGVHAIERACAHGAHVFTTVSEVTGRECTHLLGRPPDAILPNGLNIQRFTAAHHVQSVHAESKELIHRFTRSHFFPHYNFDLDRTLYFFTSGRYEPRNKGFDLALEAMARLNALLKSAGLDLTVVFFVITKRDGVQVSSRSLQSRAVLGELYETCEAITAQVGRRLFDEVATGGIPNLASLVDDYWMLRLRRTMQAWRRPGRPDVVTHDIHDATRDPVLAQIRNLWLANAREDPVKVVYHPAFVTPANPLWKMEYDQFVRGCHLGVFPSAYEPWGYTPLECLASGVPAVSSDLSGFGRYTSERFPDHDEWGAYVVRRAGREYAQSAAELADILLAFCRIGRRGRIALRNAADERAEVFDWEALAPAYDAAHELALASAFAGGAPAKS